MNTIPEHYPRNRVELADFVQARGYTVGVEVGTYLGEYAAELLRRVAFRKLFCIDLWNGCGMSKKYDGSKVYSLCQSRLDQFGRRVDMIRCSSIDGAGRFEMRNLDFIYIDADHSYEACKADIKAWFPCLRSGGMLAGHDYCNRRGKGVKRAVDELFHSNAHHTFERCPSWWLIKP